MAFTTRVEQKEFFHLQKFRSVRIDDATRNYFAGFVWMSANGPHKNTRLGSQTNLMSQFVERLWIARKEKTIQSWEVNFLGETRGPPRPTQPDG